MSLPQHLVLLGGGSQCLTCSRTPFRGESGLSHGSRGARGEARIWNQGTLCIQSRASHCPPPHKATGQGVGGQAAGSVLFLPVTL